MTDPATESIEDPVGRMADDLERIAAHLVPLLKTSYAETLERLKRAERLLAARQERPAIAGMHRLLCSVRRLDRDSNIHDFVEDELVSLLDGLGYQEFGDPGDPYEPTRHQALGGQTDRGQGRLSRVHRRGLECYGDVMIRAVVEVELEDGHMAPITNDPEDRGLLSPSVQHSEGNE
jgi:hypothetical protein